MLGHMGTNVRAILYQHALSRAGLDTTPLRDVLTSLAPLINQVIDHAWLSKVDYDQVEEYVGDHPTLAEKYPVRKFRQLLWDVIGCETVLGEWQQFTSEEQRLIVYEVAKSEGHQLVLEALQGSPFVLGWHVCRTKLPPKKIQFDTKKGLKNAKKKDPKNVSEKILSPSSAA